MLPTPSASLRPSHHGQTHSPQLSPHWTPPGPGSRYSGCKAPLCSARVRGSASAHSWTPHGTSPKLSSVEPSKPTPCPRPSRWQPLIWLLYESCFCQNPKWKQVTHSLPVWLLSRSEFIPGPSALLGDRRWFLSLPSGLLLHKRTPFIHSSAAGVWSAPGGQQ